MNKQERYEQASAIMQAIETELRSLGLWSDTLPSQQALQSTMPFMYDTLKLHQWLQFIFLPRTQALIAQGGTLPGNCHIHPLAEHEFAKLELEHGTLLDLIRQMDNVLNMP